MSDFLPDRRQEIEQIRHEFNDYHIHCFRRRANSLEDYLYQPEKLKIFLPRLIKIMEVVHALPEVAEHLIEIVQKLDEKPFHHGFSSRWEKHIVRAYHLSGTRPRLAHLQAQFLNLHAQILFERGDYQEAIHTSEQAIELALATEQPFLVVKATELVISAYHVLNDLESATEFLEEVEALFWVTNASPEFVIRYNLIKTAMYRRKGLLESARTAIEHSLELLEQTPDAFDNIFKANTYHMRAIIRWVAGAYELAKEDLTTVIQLFGKEHSSKAQAGAMCDLGLVYWSSGNLREAESWIKKSVELAYAENDQYRLVMLVGNLGLVYMSRGKLGLAQQNVEEQLERAIQQGFKREIIRAMGNLGIIQLHLGNYDKALAYLLENIAGHTEEYEGMANTYVNLSRCYTKLQNIDLARDYAQRALSIARRQGYEAVQITALCALAECSPPDEQLAIIEDALARAQNFRKLDEAACYLQLAYLAKDEQQKNSLWQQGRQLLDEIGADGWLASLDPSIPPFIVTLT